MLWGKRELEVSSILRKWKPVYVFREVRKYVDGKRYWLAYCVLMFKCLQEVYMLSFLLLID